MNRPKSPNLEVVGNETGEFQVADDLPPLVSPGPYELMLGDFYTALMFQGRAPKLILNFTIVSPGKHYGTKVPRYYNVSKIIGKPQKGGRFKVGKKGDFLREYLTLFHYDGGRLDRLPMSRFQGVVILGQVETVKFARGKNIPKPLQYSKVSNLIRVVE